MNKSIKFLITLAVFTFSWGAEYPVSVSIQNVNANAKTLEIFMTNQAGCSFCSDSQYSSKSDCELYGNQNQGATWNFNNTMDQAACCAAHPKDEVGSGSGSTQPDGICDAWFDGKVNGFQLELQNPNYPGTMHNPTNDKCDGCYTSFSCSMTPSGYSNNPSQVTKAICEDAGGSWTDRITGGTAGDNSFSLQGSDIILGFSITGASIPVGSAVLFNASLQNYEGGDICFGKDTGSSGKNTFTDSKALYIAANWGNCYCATGEDLGCGCGNAAPDTNGSCTTEDLSIYPSQSNIPEEFSISQNYPNPFNPTTSISFDVAELGEITIGIYDLAGKKVATLVSGIYSPGSYSVEWNASSHKGNGIASGMYIYRYITNNKAITRKMLYLK